MYVFCPPHSSHNTYLKKGYSEEWIHQRLLAIRIRNELTDEWKKRGVQKGKEYAILTDEISRAWSGMTTGQYKRLKGLTKENLRDNMTDLELVLTMLAEASTTDISKTAKPQTFEENKQVRSLVHPVLELPPADPSGAQEGLSVENLSCAFDKQPVFSGLGFSAKRGEVLGIVGHNGAGKTTMTRCLCGLLKEVNGTVRLDGQTLKAKQRNKASFCVMQDVNHQLFSDSVWNECELAQPDCPPERIEEILRSFDLLDFKDRHPMALSGGQKQRLAVATAILSNKDVLVFDEPTSGLDYHRMLEVSNMIRKLNDENKIIIIVSHDFEFLGRTCDKIFDMEGCSKERR